MTANKVYGYASELLRYGFENYGMQKLTDAGSTVRSVIVEEAAGNDNILELVTESELSLAMPLNNGAAGNEIETRLDIPSAVKAPVRKGDVIGAVEYIAGGNVIGKVDLIAAKSIDKALAATAAADPEPEDAEPEQHYSYAILGALLAASGFVILRTVLKRISRKLKRKRYEYRYYR
jgi:D-alanyl-D-alanine carboxypeptidase